MRASGSRMKPPRSSIRSRTIAMPKVQARPQHEEPTRVAHRAATDNFGWEGVEQRPYKEDERALYKTITRQVLFSNPEMAAELRYFEVAPGGFSTLERHEHMHGVAILRGSGQCPGGAAVKRRGTRGLGTPPPLTRPPLPAP